MKTPSPRKVTTPATVKTHVVRILAKLDLRDRAQAVVAAYESGLIQPGQTYAIATRPGACPRRPGG